MTTAPTVDELQARVDEHNTDLITLPDRIAAATEAGDLDKLSRLLASDRIIAHQITEATEQLRQARLAELKRQIATAQAEFDSVAEKVADHKAAALIYDSAADAIRTSQLVPLNQRLSRLLNELNGLNRRAA